MRVYRKDNPPCDDELAARRRGEPWNEQIKQQLIEKVHRYCKGINKKCIGILGFQKSAVFYFCGLYPNCFSYIKEKCRHHYMENGTFNYIRFDIQ